MAAGDDWKSMADLALALEHELQKERRARALAERTAEQLQEQLLKAAEEILRLQKELGHARDI
jgi:hypothetical protein